MKPLVADSKGRINLGKAYAGQIFQMNECEGKIFIEKAVLIPERELWLFENPKAQKMLQEGIEDAKKGKLKKNAIDLEKYAS